MADTNAHPLDSFTSCELSDALIKLGIPTGGHIPDIVCQLSGDDVAVRGPAYTVKMVKASDTSSPKLESHFVDTVVEGSVVVIDAPRGELVPPPRAISVHNA